MASSALREHRKPLPEFCTRGITALKSSVQTPARETLAELIRRKSRGLLKGCYGRDTADGHNM